MWRIMGEDSANVQIGAELLCKGAKVFLGLEPGLGLGPENFSGLGSRVSAVGLRSLVPRYVNSDSGTVVVCLPLPRPLPLEILLHRRLAQASLSSSNAMGSAGGRSMDLTAKPGIECRIQVNNMGILCTKVKTKMERRPSRKVWISAMKKTR